MSRYFTIYVNSGTSPGPYNVYYNTIGSGNIATVYPTGLPATNLTLNQLLVGVTVYAPVDIVELYLYNQLCETNQQFQIPQVAPSYPNICIIVESFDKNLYEQYRFYYNNMVVNGKPQYETYDGYFLTWNTNGYWEFITYPGSIGIQSNDADNIPDSNWIAVGLNSNYYVITARQGDCDTVKNIKKTNNRLTITSTEPTCYGNTNGSINAVATGSVGGWVYSLDGIMYSNSVGIFTSLGAGQYTVYAKNNNDDVISQSITLTAPPVTNFTIVGGVTVSTLPTVGNMNYYMVTVNYSTSQIPVGETVIFDYKMVYNLSYLEPGSATFDTTQHYLTLNGNPITILPGDVTLLSPTTVSTCNPIYSQYNGLNSYSASTISLVNGDIFTANIIYGIDTKTSGVFDGFCLTRASVVLNLIIENVRLICTCCNLTNTVINVDETTQNYQP